MCLDSRNREFEGQATIRGRRDHPSQSRHEDSEHRAELECVCSRPRISDIRLHTVTKDHGKISGRTRTVLSPGGKGLSGALTRKGGEMNLMR